jgi:hypothetical protein
MQVVAVVSQFDVSRIVNQVGIAEIDKVACKLTGNWVDPAGSYRGGGEGDEAVEALETYVLPRAMQLAGRETQTQLVFGPIQQPYPASEGFNARPGAGKHPSRSNLVVNCRDQYRARVGPTPPKRATASASKRPPGSVPKLAQVG